MLYDTILRSKGKNNLIQKNSLFQSLLSSYFLLQVSKFHFALQLLSRVFPYYSLENQLNDEKIDS